MCLSYHYIIKHIYKRKCYLDTHTHTYIYMLQWVNWYHFTHMIYLFQVLPTIHQTRVSWVLSVRKAAPWHNSLPQKFLNARSFNTKISECLSVNLRTDSYSYWWKSNTQFTSWYLWWSLTVVTCAPIYLLT